MAEQIVFENSLGQRLAGLLHRPARAGAALGPTVILCHGMMSAKEGRKQVEFAEALEGCGYAVLRFDFSFCGESEGNFKEITFTQEVDDLAGAVRWVREQGGGPLGLLGSSMGGAVAVLYGRRDPAVQALVTLAAVAYPQRLVDRMAELKKKMDAWREEGHLFGAEGDVGEAFFQDAKGQDVPGAIRGMDTPVLIMHGALDDVVSVDDAHALHDNARGPKRLKIFPKADHRFIREEDLEDAVSETLDWFRTYLAV
jgi:alpha-beta hydrolase superfamily lysophospholipase